MSSGPGYVKQLWFRWKSLKLPWRRQFLAGADLAGNTFWEFRDALNAGRWRRIVKYSRKAHYADVKMSRKSITCINCDEYGNADDLSQRNGISGSVTLVMQLLVYRNSSMRSLDRR